MSTRTANYDLIICEGTDVVNPLTQIFPNFTSLDDILRNIANTGITTATELVSGTVHALVRTDPNVSVFRFQATSNFTGGETFTVDGAQVSALDVSGETLRTGAYIIGSMVLCELRDTLLTVYVSGSSNAETLGGHSASYFATAADLATVDGKVDANKTLIDGLTEDLNALVADTLHENLTTDAYGSVYIGSRPGYVPMAVRIGYSAWLETTIESMYDGINIVYAVKFANSNGTPFSNASVTFRVTWVRV